MTVIRTNKLNLSKHIGSKMKELFNLDVETITFEKPKQKEHGDYATNIVMRYAKQLGMPPREAAAKLIEALDFETYHITKVDVAGPGFLNFYLDKKFMREAVVEINQLGSAYGELTVGNGTQLNVEYVSVNPTGDLHLGHARGAAIGDSLTRILKKAGYEIMREFYVNDGGNQIDVLAHSMEARYQQRFNPEHPMPEDAYHGEDIIDIVNELCETDGDHIQTLNEEDRFQFFKERGIVMELDKIKKDLAEFRVEFDLYASEKALRDSGAVEVVVDKIRHSGKAYEEGGALWLKTTDYGDDKDRVLVKSDGTYTYITPDIAYHDEKVTRGRDGLIDILGGDHHGYIKRMEAAMQILGHGKDILDIMIIQIVRLLQDGEEVKMSKRTGKSLKLRDLIDMLGVDVVRYFFVMRSIDSPLDFDLNVALTQTNENPVYYIQYAYARIQSILKQTEHIAIGTDMSLLPDEEVAYDLIEKIAAFEEVIELSARNREPHLMTHYLYSLAGIFHSYYTKIKINDVNDEAYTAAQRALLSATSQTIKNALDLIGVGVKDSM
ncbi:MAG: arginine--tRNA ligase [Culicoidibacterales bacterium]